MKGGQDEVKRMDPLFPRLHINDAEKGGPRAPPRNKMALYEQLSIPSQRLTSGSASVSPLLPNNSGSFAPSTSPNHGGGRNRSLNSPFCNSPASSHLTERLLSYSSGGMNLNTTSVSLEWRPLKPTDYHTLNAAEHLSRLSNYSFYKLHSTSNPKNCSVKKLGDEDDIRFPTFVQLGRTPNCGNGQQNTDEEKLTTSSPNRQLQTACVKQSTGNQTEEKPKMTPRCQEGAKRRASVLTKGDRLLGDESSSPLSRGRISDLIKGTPESLTEEKRSTLVDDSRRLHDSDAQLSHKCRALQEEKSLKYGVSTVAKKFVGKSNAFTLDGASCCRPSPEDNHSSPNTLENVRECHEQSCGSIKVGEADRNVDMPDISILESISGVDISPDDVVGVMGQKQFLKARRVIVHQQRVLAVQVFELHRLIKVQRLFAASPDLLLESKRYATKPSMEVLPGKKLPSENLPGPPPLISKLKDDPQKPKPNQGLNTWQPNHKPYSSPNSPPPSTATDVKPAPWFFHQPPPGNQWLVPVMSPSEGLVYKLFGGPCPPTGGFLPPVYGTCGAMNPTPLEGVFSNATYGLTSSHPQGIGIPLFGIPPFGMPLMNPPSVSSSAVEQVSPIDRARSDGHENHLNDGTKSGMSSFCARNSPASKESKVLAVTAMSTERVQGADALSLFHTAPTVHVSDQPAQTCGTEQQPRVIKVVPHNRISASESAARIFQTIQEERKCQ
ncbi:hydroxyproline-rich glycoprotein family protein [Actinidia rufa]|uniref:Hydroxyproline-rich glycoprotein family protein n=1 Tax=Actinidia rufa TaxID=165716 RepID=A0A7J0G0Y2_9ERIC|nr:hydroxyproline-rich glycoprotein family protein [Actinidia rufa]